MGSELGWYHESNLSSLWLQTYVSVPEGWEFFYVHQRKSLSQLKGPNIKEEPNYVQSSSIRSN
ncbi:hypothetical protein QFZ77_003744 [Paenibacillus sp. V4I3]|nr:hypothetical protein [Paenibacillus sp. V4I3]MDQ0889182.1 hypothetical protein [Paenibacillus sp. V4I9]